MQFDNIIRKIILILSLSLAFANLALANTYDSVEYNLNLIDIKKSVLKVETKLKGKFKNKLILDLPFKWAGKSYADQIKNIIISPKYELEVIKNDRQHQAIITLPSSTNQVEISYEIHQKPSNPSDIHDAIIRGNLVHTPGYGIFATPSDWNENNTIPITINWKNLPKKWNTLSSHGIKNEISLHIKPLDLIHAIYVAGQVRLHKIDIPSNPIFLSLYGNFDIEDHKIVSDLGEIILSQRSFFNDFDFPYYVISLIEGDNPNSMGGTRLYNNFTAFLPKGMKKTDYYILFAHEHLHNWIGGKIRNNKDEELNYWWSEGFTDFYSRLLALRSGGIKRKTFIDEMNYFLRNYYLSPVKNEPNVRIKEDFWNDYEIEKLPYYRGFVFAIYLNNMIKQEKSSNSLDNITYDLLKISYKERFSSALFRTIARNYIKNGIDSEFAKYIKLGNIISLENVKLPIERVLMGSYYLGFDRDVFLREMTIKNIDIKSNAYNAGLRNEQKVIGYDSPKGKGDPDQVITIKTTNGAFQFRPEHYNKVEIYQLKQIFSEDENLQFDEFLGIK